MPEVPSTGAVADVEHNTPDSQAVGIPQACHVLQHPPLHGLMTAATLKLDMQHERPTIGQRDVEDLVNSEHAAGQFNVELVRLVYVGLE